MSFPVHIQHPPEPDALTLLHSRLDSRMEITTGELPDPARYQVLVAGRPTHEQITASPDLRALVIPFAGLPEVTAQLMRAFPQVAIYNLHHNARPTAEMALALLMACAKSVIPVDRLFRTGDWRPRYQPVTSVQLAGKTALILGYGAVGQQVAAMCDGLGMRVIATRRRGGEARDSLATIYPPESLPELLPQADVLVITLPLTTETSGLIGERELGLLPVGAIVVNVGRAAIVDEAALYHALRSGHLHSAGLDVWYVYPAEEAERAHTYPASYPFHELDNVVMSPHRAGGGGADDVETLRMMALAGLLNTLARGESPPNRVDLDAGY